MRPRALFSVSDKHGAAELAARLAALGWDLLASGGTAKMLRVAGLMVEDVAAVTGSPEMLGGRVKTLHPKIHGGLLCRPEHDAADIEKHGIRPIALAVINLYPFREAAAAPDLARAEVIEQIDVGGPAMIRAAAKNHERVGVVVDPADYPEVVAELEAAGELSEATRRRLAAKAFAHTARYDRAICGWLERGEGADDALPEHILLELRKHADLRYGENPHQRAALYSEAGSGDVGGMRLLGGAPLSYNNLVDAELARQCAEALPVPSCVLVKHATPCGAATGGSPGEAYARAFAADPESAFGGVIAFNSALDEEAAQAVAKQFAEVVIAPEVSPAALEILAARKKLRVLEQAPSASDDASLPNLKVLRGAVLAQSPDPATEDGCDIVSKRAPTEQELADALFAWKVARYVTSNAVVYASNGQTLGIGGGQTSRVMSARIAAIRAADNGFDLQGAAMASDGFLPFADGLSTAADQGITAVIQPGGSIRDPEVIAAADDRGVAMLFTGVRHFRH